MNIDNEFSYRRKYYVRDLLNPNTLITNTGFIEFDSFDEFVRVILKDKKFDINTSAKIIVPVKNADEVELLLSISPEARSFLIIKLMSFDKETRDAFSVVKNTALLIESNRISTLKKEMLKDPSDNFVNFLRSTYGYFTNTITFDNVDDIMYKYTDSFFEFPFFCISIIKWDWKSFENMKISELNSLAFQTRLLHRNAFGQERIVDYSKYYSNDFISNSSKDIGFEKRYKYDKMKTFSCKWIYIKDGKMYIDNPSTDIYIDIYDDRYRDANNIDFREINALRSVFDVKLSSDYAHDLSMVSLSQNIKCTGNPAIIPYQCLIAARILNGGEI